MRSIALVTGLLALLPALAPAQVQDRYALFLQPSIAEAGAAFTLKIRSFRYDCGVTYANRAYSRTGNRIAVRYVPTEKKGAICPAIDAPYGPDFDAPALPAGRYEVYATPLAVCQVKEPPCDLAEREERVGILTVGKPEDADWFIRPSTVQAGKDFDLQILSEKYGNCHTSFTHTSLATQDNRIGATFVIETDPTIECIVDIHPHGPSFPVKGLKAGLYPVTVVQMPACAYEKPICPMVPPMPRVVDTLVVTGTMDVTPGNGSAMDASGPQAFLSGNRIRVAWPDGGEAWSAEILDLGGRRLKIVQKDGADIFDLPAGLLLVRFRDAERIAIRPVLR